MDGASTMRYNLESTLPINAFSPRGGRSPFSLGMTLEGGGGGGGVFGGVTKALGSIAGGITKGVQAVVQPVYNATFKQIPGVDQALVGLDKSVGSTIPGGWGTVASVAASFIPGSYFATNGLLSGIGRTGLSVGLGALTGSGVMKKGNNFNLQGAIMGGALAYGASQIAEGIQNAANPSATEAITNATKEGAVEGAKSSLTPTADVLSRVEPIPLDKAGNPIPVEGPGGNVPNYSEYYKPTQSFTPPEGSNFGLKNLASNPTVPSGDFGINPAASVGNGLGTSAAPDMLSKLSSGASSAANLGGDTLSNMGSSTYNAAKNLTGLGPEGLSGISKAASAFANPITPIGLGAGIMGASGLMAMEERKKQLQEQYAQGNIAQDEYNKELAAINEQIEVGREAVAAHPFNTGDTTSSSLSGSGNDNPASSESLYTPTQSTTERLYADGGMVNPPDDQTGIPSQSPLADNFGISNLNNLLSGYSASGMTPAKGYDFEGGGYGGQLAQQAPSQSAIDAMTAAGQYFPQGNAPQQAGSPQPYYNSIGGGIGGSLGSMGGQGNSNAFPLQGQYGIVKMAAGGMPPRFLSGGGDGMSDSIKANIGGEQEARLADGEFVIPADVVSHLGNGSSKAGAKQLYAMMDRVRKVRTGTKKQGKQINPRKYMTA